MTFLLSASNGRGSPPGAAVTPLSAVVPRSFLAGSPVVRPLWPSSGPSGLGLDGSEAHLWARPAPGPAASADPAALR
ncbi:hypothetical protein AB1460_34730 [Parafrankia sp. FMc2]